MFDAWITYESFTLLWFRQRWKKQSKANSHKILVKNAYKGNFFQHLGDLTEDPWLLPQIGIRYSWANGALNLLILLDPPPDHTGLFSFLSSQHTTQLTPNQYAYYSIKDRYSSLGLLQSWGLYNCLTDVWGQRGLWRIHCLIVVAEFICCFFCLFTGMTFSQNIKDMTILTHKWESFISNSNGLLLPTFTHLFCKFSIQMGLRGILTKPDTEYLVVALSFLSSEKHLGRTHIKSVNAKEAL